MMDLLPRRYSSDGSVFKMFMIFMIITVMNIKTTFALKEEDLRLIFDATGEVLSQECYDGMINIESSTNVTLAEEDFTSTLIGTCSDTSNPTCDYSLQWTWRGARASVSPLDACSGFVNNERQEVKTQCESIGETYCEVFGEAEGTVILYGWLRVPFTVQPITCLSVCMPTDCEPKLILQGRMDPLEFPVDFFTQYIKNEILIQFDMEVDIEDATISADFLCY